MIDQPSQNNPVLARFRGAVAEIYGDRLERVVLYGSRARGDHRPDSDYDVAVFIKDPGTLTEELDKLASVTTAILLDTGAVISAKPFYAGSYRERTAFMHDLRKDGLDLWNRKLPTVLPKRGNAKKIAGLPLPQVAAREAYLAAFHAAEAYIFEQTGRTSRRPFQRRRP
jgi:uncharacterized protein